MSTQVVKDDKLYYLNFTIKDSEGTVVNITGTTIKFKVAKGSDPGTLKVDGVCTDIVGVSGTCRYQVQAADFDVVEIYKAELEVTYTATTKIITAILPNIQVITDLGP